MNKKELIKIKKLPTNPGVYIFLNKNKNPIYIGKATSLRNRVKSYFSSDILKTRGPLISKMMIEASSIKFEETDSVLEALILESYLIKKYQPLYNTKEKDNKSFNFVVFTKEKFPRVLIMRGREIEKGIEIPILKKFGPFPQGPLLRDALKIIRKIFPFRDKCTPFDELKDKNKVKACFNNQLGLCPGVCTGEVSKEEYGKTIKNLILFFEGKKKSLIKKLEKEMSQLAKKREFEKAEKVKKMVFSLKHINDISLIKNGNDNKESLRIEAYDISHTSGKETVGVMTVIENGSIKKDDYRKFKIKVPSADDNLSLREVLLRRFKHSEWSSPDVLVVDGGIGQINTALAILKGLNMNIYVVGVVKDDKHKPKEIIGMKDEIKNLKDLILLANNEAHRFVLSYHRKLRGNLV